MLRKLLYFFVSTFILTTSATLMAAKGDILPAEWKTLPALDKDYEVIQLTKPKNKSINSKMYLNVNPYVSSLNSVVIASDRNKYENLYLLSLDNGTMTQLTASKTMDSDHSNVCDAIATAFYREDYRTIKSVELTPPYKEKIIITVPTNYIIVGNMFPSADGSKLAVSLYEKKKDTSTLATIDLSSPAIKAVHQKKGRIDHVIMNQDGNKLLYHINGDNRVGVVDIEQDHEYFINEKGERAVHPFWFADGIRAGYILRLDKKHEESKYQRIVEHNMADNTYVKYQMPTYYSNHCAVNPSGNIIQGDGNANNPYIYYYTIDSNTNTLKAVKMFQHNSTFSDERWHPHANFINDTDLIFNSDADGAGKGNVYLLRKKK